MKTVLPRPDGPGPLPRPNTLKDQAYREIKQQLVSGRLAPDRIYSAQHFAEQLKVSRTPAREALLQLTSEGFFVCLDVRGFKVKEFCEAEIHEVFETRRVIECYVVNRAAKEMSAEDLKKLKESVRVMSDAAENDDRHAFLETDNAFHHFLVGRTNNRHLIAITENMRDYLALLGWKALAHQGRMQEVLREHRVIVESLDRRDANKAVQAMREHLATTERYCLTKG